MAAPTKTSKYIFAPGAHTTTNGVAEQYLKGALDKENLAATPFKQFDKWFEEAQDASVPAPEALTLSTASLPSGKVSARIVLLKELDERGFVIYSNWGTSRKQADITSNPYAALTFWWGPLERQIRVEGAVERISAAESQAYFATRVRGSQIGAHASAQSSVIQSRDVLERRVDDMKRKFDGVEEIPVPENWGGLRVLPDMVEFWQGRNNRLHDRFQYHKDDNQESGWRVDRLAP